MPKVNVDYLLRGRLRFEQRNLADPRTRFSQFSQRTRLIRESSLKTRADHCGHLRDSLSRVWHKSKRKVGVCGLSAVLAPHKRKIAKVDAASYWKKKEADGGKGKAPRVREFDPPLNRVTRPVGDNDIYARQVYDVWSATRGSRICFQGKKKDGCSNGKNIGNCENVSRVCPVRTYTGWCETTMILKLSYPYRSKF